MVTKRGSTLSSPGSRASRAQSSIRRAVSTRACTHKTPADVRFRGAMGHQADVIECPRLTQLGRGAARGYNGQGGVVPYRRDHHVHERAAKKTDYSVKNVETVAAGKGTAVLIWLKDQTPSHQSYPQGTVAKKHHGRNFAQCQNPDRI